MEGWCFDNSQTILCITNGLVFKLKIMLINGLARNSHIILAQNHGLMPFIDSAPPQGDGW